MGIFANIRNAFTALMGREKAPMGNPASVYEAGFGGGGLGYSDGGRTRQWLEEFETNCHLRAPFARLAEDTSLIKWKLVRKQKNGKKVEVRDHKLLTLLKRPDPSMTGMVWEQTLQLQHDIGGEWFCGIVLDEEGDPCQLPIIPPHWVKHTPKPGKVYYEVQVPGGVKKQLGIGEVIWHKRARPANPYTRGLGIAPSLDDEVSQLTYMNKFNNAFFRQGAHLGTVLAVDGMKPETWERFRSDFEDKHAGVHNAFRTTVVTGKVTGVNSATAHKDLDYNNGVKLKRDVVRQTVGSPPEIHGQTDNSNKATAQAADHLHQSYGLLPRVHDLCEALNTYLVPLFGEPDLELEYENPVKETKELILEKADRGVARGVLTINQWLQTQGMDPVPDGDVYLVPKNVTIVKAGELHKAAETAQSQADATIARLNQPQSSAPAAPPKDEKAAETIPGKSLDQHLEALQK